MKEQNEDKLRLWVEQLIEQLYNAQRSYVYERSTDIETDLARIQEQREQRERILENLLD